MVQVSIVQVRIFFKCLHMSKTRLTFVEINSDEINFNVQLFRSDAKFLVFHSYLFRQYFECLIKNNLTLMRISFHGSS